MNDSNFKLGLTSTFDCNYLADQQERLLIAVDERLHNSDSYSWLMSQGFRRSGEQIYRPHCPNCHACQSVRVEVEHFKFSKSQKRLIKKNQAFIIKQSQIIQKNYYPLYELYINTIHQDGSMYPATKAQFSSFLMLDSEKPLTEQVFIETWHQDKLICVAVTDILIDGLSAVYTFYHPQYRQSALGIYSILKQISSAQSFDKKYLYLGYQIDQCQKMNYKNKFFPYQILIQNIWKSVNK